METTFILISLSFVHTHVYRRLLLPIMALRLLCIPICHRGGEYLEYLGELILFIWI